MPMVMEFVTLTKWSVARMQQHVTTIQLPPMQEIVSTQSVHVKLVMATEVLQPTMRTAMAFATRMRLLVVPMPQLVTTVLMPRMKMAHASMQTALVNSAMAKAV